MVLPTNTEEERQRNQVHIQLSPARAVSVSSRAIFRGPSTGSRIGKGKTTFTSNTSNSNNSTNPNYNGFVGLS